MSVAAAEPAGRRLAWAAAWLSASVLAFEISLLRLLQVASWHHFAFLVISLALLGFGASGTALTLFRSAIMRRPRPALVALILAAAVAMPLAAALVPLVPIEARIIPALRWQQLGAWVLVFTLLFMPFLLGAAALGGALMIAGPRVAAVYGANLLGSAAGALAAPLAMALVAPEWLPALCAGPALLGAAGLRRGAMPALGAAALIALGLWLLPPHVRIDEYKYGAYVRQLVAQGQASLVATHAGPRGLIEAYRSDALHDLPFLGLGAAPPPLTAIVIDGHWAGSLLHVRGADDAAVMDHTLMAAPYALAPPRPRVVLLGEIGGANAWLALRHGAPSIDVVQPHGALVRLLRGPLRAYGGHVVDAEGVRVIVSEERRHVEHTGAVYDLIQLAGLEGSAAGSGGVGGLGQNHLVTVQGLAACLNALSDDGLLVICRAMQTPPRDNIRIFTTVAAALRSLGASEPGRHVVVLRDYLAVCTIVRRTPWSADSIAAVRRLTAERQLTPVWFEGITAGELNRPDALPGPPHEAGDWYHHAAVQLFSGRADAFIDGWHFDVRPPTDDRPFFLDFCKLRSLGALRRAFGEHWLTRSELAFPFVLGAAAVIAVAGALLTLLPLPWLARGGAPGAARGRAATAAFFGAIGLAYLLLEMALLGRLAVLIGEELLTAALIIGGFLAFSGAGCLTVQRHPIRRARALHGLFAALVGSGGAVLLCLPAVAHLAGSWPLPARALAALTLIAPLAYLMGFPMALGLERLERGAPALTPWAWGVNGFASVLAPPLAMALGMARGFSVAAALALVLYALAGLAIGRLPRSES